MLQLQEWRVGLNLSFTVVSNQFAIPLIALRASPELGLVVL